MSTEIEAVGSALDAIAAHFACLNCISSARRGWPEHQQDLDLTDPAKGVISVVATSNEAVIIAPDVVDNTDPDNATWRVAYLTIEAQMDLWCPYREVRDKVARIVQQNMHNDLPYGMGLRLTSTGYFGRPLTVDDGGGRPVDDDSAAHVGEWRQRWPLSISTDLVVKAASPKQAIIRLRATVNGLTEPDKDVT